MTEVVKILGVRAMKLSSTSNGDFPRVEIGNLSDSMDIAMKELAEGKCPMTIKRGGCHVDVNLLVTSRVIEMMRLDYRQVGLG